MDYLEKWLADVEDHLANVTAEELEAGYLAVRDNPIFYSLRGGGKTCLIFDLEWRDLTGESLWAEPDWLDGEWISYTLMKTKSKQSRYVRVWRNK